MVSSSAGSPRSGGSPNVTVNLVKPGTFYPDRINQLDLRLSKVFRFGARRAGVNLDIANALNASSVFVRSQEYGNWLQPQDILQARFVKIGMQFDF
jgi:hypothetical protein